MGSDPIGSSDNSPGESLTVPTRIHVMPLGFEKERVYNVAGRLNADLVVLIVHTEDNLNNNEYYQSVSSELDRMGIDFEKEQGDIFDLYDSLSVIGEQISKFDTEDIFVNVATGSKVTAIAGMIACMAFEATPYYVKGDGYEETKTPKDGDIIRLPKYKIDAPAKEQVRILEFIYRESEKGNPPSKSDLIEEAERQQLPFIESHDVQDKGKYRLLDRSIIDPLLEAGYVELKTAGRNKEVILTENGKDAVRAFESLV